MSWVSSGFRRRLSGGRLAGDLEFEEVCGAADAGVPGADEFFAFICNLLIGKFEEWRQPLHEVEFNLSLVL
ncbi:MAG: hypothetical protein RLZZ436_3836 [Planctomycetota bacterium]